MNDHTERRRGGAEPAWPTDVDPDQVGHAGPAGHGRAGSPQEATGFWSPLWEDDEPAPAGRSSQGPRHGANGTPSDAPRHGAGQHAAFPTGTPGAHRHDEQAHRNGPPPNGQSGRPGYDPDATVRVPLLPPRPPIDDGPTTLLPVVGGGRREEPQLLTHREPEFVEPEGYGRPSGMDPGGDPGLTEEQARKLGRKKVWRRVRRTCYVLAALMIIGPIAAFFFIYQSVDVPSPELVAADQARVVTLQYGDGSEMTKLVPDGANRVMVKYEDIPRQVLNAVYSAEDSTFETNSGFDLTGVLWAGFNQLTGGKGGGSTITQQYIKKATNNDDPTLTRKVVEVVKAYKMNETYEKNDIITAYLNTIYFGRGAYGVAAAAKSYYNKDLKDLTPSESALLAGMIQSPSRFKDVEYMTRRWNYVMDQLVGNSWLTEADRRAATFPAPVPIDDTKAIKLTGPRGLIETQVFRELEKELGLTREEIQLRGYTIQTTIDPKAQTIAEESVAKVMEGQPPTLMPGLVAVDPKTGRVVAYYGGADGTGYDYARAPQQPGSSFKPFDLVALLKTGKGLGEVYDGSSPRKFPGRSKPVSNSEGAQCPECTVAEAMKRSINTVFYDMALKLGPSAIAKAAQEAGVTSSLEASVNDANISIGGGMTEVTTMDMASSYATFAANGTHRDVHLLAKVTNPEGGVVWELKDTAKPAFDGDARKNAKIARNVTESMIPVIKYSNLRCPGGRECAGKTGTHQLDDTKDNEKAWMVGYTPQLSAAVSMTAVPRGPIKNAQGKIVYGSGLPGSIWQLFMERYHAEFKLKKESFGKYEPIGKPSSETGGGSATSRPSQTHPPGKTKPNQTQPPATQPTTTDPEPTRTRTTRPTVPSLPSTGG